MKPRVLVVGANGSLAQATIRHLLADGYVELTMGVRTHAKGLAARESILASLPTLGAHDVQVVDGFDMNDPKSIRASIARLSGRPFGVVFLAAGFPVFSDDFEIVEHNGQRIEKQVFQNAMGAHATLSSLVEADMVAEGARVVVAGGEGARGIAGMIASPSFESADQFRKYVTGGFEGEAKYDPMNAIGVSKLCSALWTRKLATLVDDMDVVWFTPGLTTQSAGLGEHLPPFKARMMGFMLGVMKMLGRAQSPSAGGRKFADCLEGKVGRHGDLIGAPAGKAVGPLTDQSPMNPHFTDPAFIDTYWAVLEDVFGPFGAGASRAAPRGNLRESA